MNSDLFTTLHAIASHPTGTTSAGFPYLSKASWQILRNQVPLLFAFGGKALSACTQLESESEERSAEEQKRYADAMQVVRQVTYTAGITAPPDLWLLRNVLAAFATLGLHQRLAQGDALFPEVCMFNGRPLNAAVLRTDLEFFQARGLVEAYDDGYRMAGHPRALQIFESATPLPDGLPSSTTRWWRDLFFADELSEHQSALLQGLGADIPKRADGFQNHWIATADEIELGFRLLPVVLGLRATGQTATLKQGAVLSVGCWQSKYPQAEAAALNILQAAGWMDAQGNDYVVTELGARGFSRGPGPFGIIETYQAYLDQGVQLLEKGTADVWVERGENVGASQDANRRGFMNSNDALDRFSEATHFEYNVFIEHAVGRGEATRIRFERSGDDTMRYFGADLEDAAIDEAQREQQRGVLPAKMEFVRRADIGCPETLKTALEQSGVSTQGAVMMVGNGFHEVRDQDFESMTKVLSGYEGMGIVLLFTEENALSVEDLRNTAWNTYHSGFKYVHALSGQVLRPGVARTPHRSGHLMRASWEECALAAGYVRAGEFCSRTRTIYPYPTQDGHNPSVSSNHFFIPGALAAKLGLE
ncbi:MAG: hypothetical protein O3A95_03855 [Planctomycetota bacterium]|nr:hypothetical protein [Planctomycetota bacterium]